MSGRVRSPKLEFKSPCLYQINAGEDGTEQSVVHLVGGSIVTIATSLDRKWNRWFDVVRGDIVNAHYYRRIYRDVGSIVAENPAIQKPSSFYVLLSQGYVTLELVIIRRQVGHVRKDSISLTRLLKDIEAHPTVLSRQRFHGLFEVQGLDLARIDRKFCDAGVDPCHEHIDPASVRDDLCLLEQQTNLVHKYTDKAIAHLDAHGCKGAPTFGDIDDAIDLLARLCRKYSMLLRGDEIRCFEPIMGPGWQDVFKVPWIQEEKCATPQE
jgi:hypothetical protein